eukprot:Skav203548  [mRNA]  locus=scaffold3576:25249:29754:+ [translate_table: standard]
MDAGLGSQLVPAEDDGDAVPPAEGVAQAVVPSLLDGLQLPYKVATIQDLQQRAYITPDGCAEWLFTRAHSFCQVSMDPGRFLRLNQEAIVKELENMQIPKGQFHYRGKDVTEGDDPEGHARKWKDHTFESRAFLGFLLFSLRIRSLKAFVKVKALNLFLELAAKAFPHMNLALPLMAMATRKDGTMVSKELTLSQQGVCYNLTALLDQCPGAAALWQKLTTRIWMNKCIVSGAQHASFADLLFFLAYIYCHPKLKLLGQNLWESFGKNLLGEAVCRTGDALTSLALSLCDQALVSLPALKSKAGFVRKLADPVNRVLLLLKLKKEKLNRRRIAGTHKDLGGGDRVMVYENYMDCLLHMTALQKEFSDCNQVSICWDPSTYGGKEMLMSIAYDPDLDRAAYLMVQQMTQTMLSELHPALLPSAKGRKLVRLEGFKEMKGLSSALESIGLTLADFQVPNGLLWRPLAENEYRLAGPDGQYFIANSQTHEISPQIPAALDLSRVAFLVSISDQGPNIIGATNYLQFSKNALMMVTLFDPFHRVWNDLKAAFKGAKCSAWRVVLELTLVANLPYGPFGSSAWHYKKLARLEDFISTKNCSDEAWQKYQHLICRERKVPEPTTFEDCSSLFETLGGMGSFCNKGPLIKLMRWFSWFESMLFLEGDLWATKMILESADGSGGGSDQEIDEKPIQAKKDHKQELQELKKRKGSWKLAPELINSKNIAVKDCIMAIGKSSWQLFAERARKLLSPNQVLEFNLACSYTGYWKQELADIVYTSLEDPRHIQHLFPENRLHADVLVWHVDLMEKLLQSRAQSLAVFHCLPPNMYNHLLHPAPEISLAAAELALGHWGKLLAAEEAQLAGAEVKPLKYMYWRLSPAIRTLLLAYEQDKAQGRFNSMSSAALKLQRLIAKNLGDSRVIENIHQHGRDLFRSSKANRFSNTSIMANALRSGVLNERKVAMVNADAMEKLVGKGYDGKGMQNVTKTMTSRGKQLPKEIQEVMLAQKGDHTWPSPAAGSLFQSVMSTHWLFYFWNNDMEELQGQSCNAAWVSFLARPGSILAQKSKGFLIKVLASAEFGFVGMRVEVRQARNHQRCYCCSQGRDMVQFFYIWDLDDWLDVPVEPILLGGNSGPIGWVPTGEAPLPLHLAALVCGHNMTFQQALGLLRMFDGADGLKANPSKNIVMTALIKCVVPEHLQERALSHLKAIEAKEENMFDSDFSEVLSELDQDDANAQDLKELKEKKKFYKMKRKMGVADGPIPKAKAKAKAKGKAKAKAKAKGKAKAEPKAKLGLGRALIQRAQKKMAEHQKEEEAAKAFEHDLVDALAMDVDAAASKEAEKAEGAEREAAEVVEARALEVDEEAKEGEGVEEGVLVAREEAPEPAPARPRAEKKRSPEELLSLIEPPGCKMGISFNVHTFISYWHDEHLELPAPFHQKSFSRAFYAKRSWRDALIEVHGHNWKKWRLVKDEYPLGDKGEMVPEQIPESIFEQLQPIIDKLPPYVRYSK